MPVLSTVAVCAILFVCSAAAQGYHVVGTFGNQIIPLDITFGKGVMEVKSYRPANAPDNFRATSNLHVFSTNFVAIKNAADQQCYIQRFNATMEGMKRRLEGAEHANGMLDGVKEEWVRADRQFPLKTWTVELLFGQQVADFCRDYAVFLVDSRYSGLVDPKHINPSVRSKRGLFFNWRSKVKCLSRFAQRLTGGIVQGDGCDTNFPIVC